jgi:hypothetical protein
MKKAVLIILSVCVGLVFYSQSADALRITLKRVVFEGPKRTEVITLINSSNEPETYRLGWRDFIMTEGKSLKAIPEGEPLPPELRPAKDMVRFAPRRFTIPPKSSQQVRMMLRMPANLPDGEYRSHLWVHPEEPVDELKKGDDPQAQRKTGVSIKMLAGVTMPVIVRKGSLSATAGFADVVATESPGFVAVTFSLLREGNKSLYGDIDFICNAGTGAEYVLRNTRGIGMYTEINRRNFNLRIEKGNDKPNCNNLTLRYFETDGFVGKKTELLTETTVPVS